MRLWHLFASLILAVSPLIVLGEDFGFLRVVVFQANPQHTSNITLLLNGNSFLSFSHSLPAPLSRQVPGTFLAAGTSTPVSASYRGLQAGCEFNFSIEYSRDQTSWINLGTYHAPTSYVSAAIPIGVCQGNLCSSNPKIQAAIDETNRINEERRWKENGEAIKSWLDKAIQDKLNAEQALADQIESANVTSSDDQGLSQALEQINAEASMAVPATQLAGTLDATIEAALQSGQISELAQKNEAEKAFLDQCGGKGDVARYYCASYGEFGWVVAAADAISIAMSVDREAASQRWAGRVIGPDGSHVFEDALAKNSEMRFRIQEAIQLKRAKDIGAAVARAGLDLTPISEVLSFCEATSGHEFCLPNGRKLDQSERFMAVLGTLIGDRIFWENASPEIRKAIFSGFEDPDSVARIADKIAAHSDELSPAGVSHVLFGEYEHASEGLTTIKSGMHSDAAVQSLIGRWEQQGFRASVREVDSLSAFAKNNPSSSEILHFTSSNGVEVYQFPSNRFASDRLKANIAVIDQAGQNLYIEGAKTIFPRDWSEEQILNAIISVKSDPATKVARNLYQGTYQGVPIALRINDGVVATAYPLVGEP